MGIFKSTNDGETWTSISTGIKWAAAILKIVISPNDQTENTLFAATTRGLYKTTNGGSLWEKIIPEEDDDYLVCNDVCFSPDGNRVYAVGPSEGHPSPYNKIFDGIGYWRSDDGGSNFDPVPQNTSYYPRLSNAICDRTLCAVSKASGGDNFVWFISFDNLDRTNFYVYKSTNGGESFTSSARGRNDHTYFQLVLRPSDVDRDICFAGAECLYKTSNGGTSWECIDGYSWMGCPENTHVDFLALDFNPWYPSHITVGNDGGVFRSTDLGSSWTSCNQNLGGFALLHGFATSTYDANFVAGGLHDYGFGYNSNAGPGSTYWYSIDMGSDGGNMTVSPFKSKHFIGNKLYDRSIHYSYNGTYFENANVSLSGSEHQPFAYHPTEPGVVYTVRYEGENPQQVHFRKSIDYGASWGGENPWRSFQRPSGWPSTCPELIAISQSNPNTIIMNFGNVNEFFLQEFDARSRLVKSTNGGLYWIGIDENTDPIVYGGQSGRGVPNRSFTDIEFDPKDENGNLIYLTVSGYYYPSTNEGHVFKSTDGGYNWTNISGSLPDMPVTDLMIHYTGTGSNDKELIVATDAGIYHSNAESIAWSEIAGGFPNTTAFYLNYNRLSGKLRTNTWGRGAWEYQLDENTIYVQDKLYITDNVSIDKDIVVCSGGKLILGYENFPSINIYFASDKKITVLNGGQIDASSGSAITLTSQSGTWGGIEFQGEAYGTLNNITFSNTSSPIVVNGFSSLTANDIIIDHCHFSEGQVFISQRDKVRLTYSDFTLTNFGSDNSVIFINGSSDIDINNNTITFNNNLTRSTGISANYSNVFIQNNTISKGYTGIYESNCNSGIDHNTIVNTNGDPAYAYIGIELVNCYSTGMKYNTVTGYQRGMYLFNSSPVMRQNNFNNTNTSGSEIDALHADYFSSPRLTPLYEGNEVVLDAGENTLLSTGDGNGIRMDDGSWPIIDYGYNTINGQDKYITGSITSIPIDPRYFVRCNSWQTESPDPGKFTLEGIEVVYEPFVPSPNCEGGGEAGSSKRNFFTDEPIVEPAIAILNPPTYMIVDRGYGHFDTLLVHSSSVSLPADQMLYMQANKEELLSNFSLAINKYKQVVSSYQDSLSALNSLKRIITCYDRMNADSSQYSLLREYYLNLAQSNQNDTAFCSVLKELAAKTLVRKTEYPQAITEYENIIETSTDSSQILCAELNIIQTYMLIPQPGGNAPSFTGKLSYLKPNNIMDGYRKMQQLLHGNVKGNEHKIIPSAFNLAQNYPNPFNPVTNISYSLPQNTKVVIKVYDILGRLVKELVNEYKEAGIYKIKFDGTNLSSGVYFYKIEAGTFADTKKMVLVK